MPTVEMPNQPLACPRCGAPCVPTSLGETCPKCFAESFAEMVTTNQLLSREPNEAALSFARNAIASCEYGFIIGKAAAVDTFAKHIALAFDAETAQLRARLDEAVNLLREFDGVGFDCPFCNPQFGHAHSPDCRLAKVLKGESAS